MRRGSLLDLILANKEGLTGDVKVEGSLGYNDPTMVKFNILRAKRGSEGRLDWTSGEQSWVSTRMCL